MSMTDFVEKYSPLGNEQVSDEVVSIAGIKFIHNNTYILKYFIFIYNNILTIKEESILDVPWVKNLDFMIYVANHKRFRLWLMPSKSYQIFSF